MIGAFLGSLLGSSKATDTAIDFIRKAGDLDQMSAQEKSKFILDYLAATKHQSPVRRFLAVTVTFMWAVLIVSWMVLCVAGNLFGIEGSITTAGLFFTMIKEVSPFFTTVIAFYFTGQLINSWKSK